MATVEDVANAAFADLNCDPGILNGARWVNERYHELTALRMKHLRRSGELVIPAVVSTGTATATRGSNLVTGSPSALAAWTSKLIGRYFRGRINWHRIDHVNGSGLVLASTFSEDSTSAATYIIATRYVPLPEEAQYVSVFNMQNARLRRPIRVGSINELEVLAGDRLYRTGGPEFGAEMGEDDATGLRMFEFYPYSTTDELVTFVYWRKPRKYDIQAELPSFLTVEELKQGVLIDVMRWKMSASEDKDEKAHWRNEYRAQETRWKEIRPKLIKRDQAIEDLAPIIQNQARRFRDVRNARDEVYVRGARP